MILDLHSFIKVDSLREELERSCVVVSNIQEADNYANDVIRGLHKNVIFERSNLKSYCFRRISEQVDVNIINCNSCLERFCEDVIEHSRLTIFDNINQCKNLDIISLALNRKGILVC